MAFLDFENGASASIVYSGYDHFDSDELHGWIAEGGFEKTPRHGATRRALATIQGTAEEQRARSERYGYGGAVRRSREEQKLHQPHFGLLVVTCEKADLRPSADGVYVYDNDGVRELAIEVNNGRPGRGDVLDELYAAVVNGSQPAHNGAFARGTVAVVRAILESARSRREVSLG